MLFMLCGSKAAMSFATEGVPRPIAQSLSRAIAYAILQRDE